MLLDRRASVFGFWVVVADDGVCAHRQPLLFHECVVRVFEYDLCRYKITRTWGLAPLFWTSTRRLHGAEMLGVCTYNVSFLRDNSQSQIVASGIRRFVGNSQAMQIFLRVPSMCQKANARPTSNFLRHSSSLDSSTLRQTTPSTRILLVGNPCNFSSSKQLPSRSKTRLLVSPHAWDIRNPKPSS